MIDFLTKEPNKVMLKKNSHAKLEFVATTENKYTKKDIEDVLERSKACLFISVETPPIRRLTQIKL